MICCELSSHYTERSHSLTPSPAPVERHLSPDTFVPSAEPQMILSVLERCPELLCGPRPPRFGRLLNPGPQLLSAPEYFLQLLPYTHTHTHKHTHIVLALGTRAPKIDARVAVFTLQPSSVIRRLLVNTLVRTFRRPILKLFLKSKHTIKHPPCQQSPMTPSAHHYRLGNTAVER